MEKNQQLQKGKEMPLQTFLKEASKNMMPSETKLIELKYAAKRFKDMDIDELALSANMLLIKIAVITGWTPPVSSFVQEEMLNQLAKKMIESYGNLNMEEAEYAFRNKGLNIKDWGKVINLAMIDDVLMPFLDNRFDLSMQEEKIRSQIEMKKENQKLLEAPKMTDEDWDTWLVDIAKYPLNKIPTDSYEYLTRSKKIELTAQKKHEYMDRAVSHLLSITDIQSLEGIALHRMKKEGVFSHEITATLITTAKRLIVFDYLQKQNDNTKSTKK